METSRASKMVRVVNNNDRISSLPSHIRDIILELLPIRDAVRTSVLSKNWKYSWATISKLVLDARFFRSLRVKYPKDSDIKKTIYKFLLLHNGPMLTFKLIINYLKKLHDPEVHDPKVLSLTDDLNEWLLFLSRKGIKELVLSLPSYTSGPRLVTLGSNLFSCQGLTHLTLHNCILSPSFEGFPNLIYLRLILVVIVGKHRDFISSCCQLEILYLMECSGIDILEVRAPKLRNLSVQRRMDLKTIYVNSPRNLTTLAISFFSTTPQVKSGVLKLCLGDNIIEFLGSGGVLVPKRLPTKMDYLTKLALYSIDFQDARLVSCILCLIQSSPNLFHLTIKGLQSLKFDDEQELSCLAEDCDDNNCSSFSHLRIVIFFELRGLRREMGLIKSLLANSPVLETMIIHSNKAINNDRLLHMWKDLNQFHQASQRARFFSLPDYKTLIRNINL